MPQQKRGTNIAPVKIPSGCGAVLYCFYYGQLGDHAEVIRKERGTYCGINGHPQRRVISKQNELKYSKFIILFVCLFVKCYM